MCACVCVQCVTRIWDQLHICANTWWDDMDVTQKGKKESQTSTPAQSRSFCTRINMHTHTHTHALALQSHIHTQSQGRLPNQPPVTILSCHSLSRRDWWSRGKAGLTPLQIPTWSSCRITVQQTTSHIGLGLLLHVQFNGQKILSCPHVESCDPNAFSGEVFGSKREGF